MVAILPVPQWPLLPCPMSVPCWITPSPRFPRKRFSWASPNYGYDWPLPFVRGTTRAQSISNQYAIELAIRYHIAIQYDETAQSPFFHYTDASGTVHEVWFEDARSMAAKLNLIAEYGFRGAGFWNLIRPFPQTWQVLNSLYQITP